MECIVMNHSLLFSFVIPVYNVDRYLERCLNSILNQTYVKFEILLIDDGSTDRSPEICDTYALNDVRIRVIHKQNEGANSARNVGIDEAKGDYICLVDSDDSIQHDYLESIKSCIEESPQKPDIIFIGHKMEMGIEKCQRIEIPKGYYSFDYMQREIFPYGVIRGVKKFNVGLIPEAPWRIIYKKDLLQEHCCRNSKIKVFNDIAFTYECVYSASNLYVCDKEIYIYNDNSANSLQRSYHPNLMQSDVELFKYWDKHLVNLHESLLRQLAIRKCILFYQSFLKYCTTAPSLIRARKDLKKSLSDSDILNMLDVSNMSLVSKVRIELLKMHVYIPCLVLQLVMEKIKIFFR